MITIKIYNMFPRSYASVPSMVADLARIRDMGFNALWINPIQVPGTKTVVERSDRLTGQKRPVTGSIYAATGEYAFLPHLTKNKTTEKVIQEFQLLTQTAVQNQLTPLFDLVLHHLSLDSHLIQKHPQWFIQHSHGEWDDIKPFDYSNEQITEEIFHLYWKPLINWYIDTLGFRGVRLDAVSELRSNILRKIIRYIREKLETQYQIKNPIILAEFFGAKTNEMIHSDTQIPFSHTLNTIYHQCPAQMQTPIVFHASPAYGALTLKGGEKVAFTGGTVGFSGNHDNLPLAAQCSRRYQESYGHALQLDNPDHRKTLEILMKETIAMVALGSDSGWYMLGGDEHGEQTLKEVFTHPDGQNLYEFTTPTFNLASFIRKINECLDKIIIPVHQEYSVTFERLSSHPSIIIITKKYDQHQYIFAINLEKDTISELHPTESVLTPMTQPLTEAINF